MARETRLEPAEWERAVEIDGGAKLRLAATLGVYPLARVDVEDGPDAVTVTLYERFSYDPAIPEEEQAVIAIGIGIRLDVPLPSPLAGRRLIDGATGRARRPRGRIDRPGAPVPVGREFDWEELVGDPCWRTDDFLPTPSLKTSSIP